MTLSVRLTPAAVQDVILAERWYLEEAPHVAASFRDEIDKTLGRISEQPASYRVVEAAVRRAPMRKFPFSLFYCETFWGTRAYESRRGGRSRKRRRLRLDGEGVST